MKFSSLIFDFGNVLLDLDIPRTYSLLKELVDPKFEKEYTIQQIYRLNEKLETNEISDIEFRDQIRALSKTDITDEAIDEAFNAMLLRFPAHRFELLLSLRQSYNCYLLSNTNAIHLKWVYAYLDETHAITDFDTRYFDKTYYSHLVGLRKPNPEIFNYVLTDIGIETNECLFIDDNEDNIKVARSLGIQSIHHNPKNEVGEILREMNIY